MYGKRAQLSIYIALGFIILLISIVLVRRNLAITDEVLPEDLQPAKEYLGQCVQQSLDTAVRDVALQGGYAIIPSPYTVRTLSYLSGVPFPYYLRERTLLIPDAETVAASIAVIAEAELRGCLAESPELKGYRFSLDAPRLSVQIADAHVDAKLDAPITIIGAQSTYRASSMGTSAALPIGTMRNIAEALTRLQAENPDRWCVTCISDFTTSDIAIQPDFFGGEGEPAILYALVQRNVPEPLVFHFAHRLPHQEYLLPPAIPDIGTLTAHVGEPFTYALSPTADVLYADDSPLFDIDPFTGTITFTPTADQRGTYVTAITVTTPNGDFAQETFTLEVTA